MIAFSSNNKVAIAADFAKEAVKLCRAQKFATDTRLQTIADKTDEKEKSLTISIKSDRAVSGLEASDSERDTVFSSIGYFLKGATFSPDEQMASAAKIALSDWERYGRAITTAKYEEETTYIRSYLGDTAAQKYEDICKKVSGLKEWLLKLTEAQTAFDAAFSEYMAVSSAPKKSASAIKKELVELLNKCLLPYISALAFIDSDYKALESELEARLARIK